MEFYHNLITQKSFDYLKELGKKYNFILIGGWAVYLWSRALKSKDIDIIISYEELAKMKENQDVFKNDRLKKYEVKTGEFDIDIYLEHYSELGIDIRNIKNGTISKSGFHVPSLEMLFLLKLYAYNQRKGSTKGQKDELDIFSLAFLSEFSWDEYKKLITKLNFMEYNKLFKNLLKSARSIKELEINEQKMSKIKKNILSSIHNL